MEPAITFEMEFPSIEVGNSDPLIRWQDILISNFVTLENTTTSFFEVEPDGVLRKEEKPNIAFPESEILIDSSGSMNMQKIVAILRECKNILSSSHIKVGFFDVKFYGWNEINSEDDIDKLQIIGRESNNFELMAKSFSPEADNKIIITDGEWTYPKNCFDVIWIIINRKGSFDFIKKTMNDSINAIFVDEDEIPITKKALIRSNNKDA